MVAWATSIRLSTSSASTRAVLNTRDLSCSVTALACARSAAILRTPSSMPAWVRNTPASVEPDLDGLHAGLGVLVRVVAVDVECALLHGLCSPGAALLRMSGPSEE